MKQQAVELFNVFPYLFSSFPSFIQTGKEESFCVSFKGEQEKRRERERREERSKGMQYSWEEQ